MSRWRMPSNTAWGCRSILSCVCIGAAGLVQAQAPASPRLPQDSTVEPKPANRDAPIIIERDRYAEQAPPGAEQTMLRIDSIELVGNTKVPSERLSAAWSGLLGKEVTLSAVFDAASRVSAAYREEGYVLSQAVVPQQQIAQAGGRVRIRVLEGYVSRINVAQDLAGRERIEKMLVPILAERPLTLATLERHLLLLNDLPGVSARAALRAGQEANSAEIELSVTRDVDAYSISAHNRTTSAVGPVRLELSAERRGLLGDFDRHVLRYVGSASKRLNLVAYSGDAPMGYDGAQVQWSASASRSQPKSGELFLLDTDAKNVSLGASYPILRSRNTNLSIRSALAAYDGSTDVADGLVLSEEKLRTFRVGITADKTDGWGGINLLDIEYVKGLSALGASKKDDPLLGRAGVDPQFSKTALYAARLQSLGGELNMLIAASALQSTDFLPSSEQFSLGGDAFLRAYDASEILGDKGAAAKVELRYNLGFGLLLNTLYAYYDAGTVRVRQFDGSITRQSARSTGLGVRFSAPYGLRGYLEVAKPIGKPTAKNGDEKARVFGGVGADL